MNKSQQLNQLKEKLQTAVKDVEKLEKEISEMSKKEKVNPWGLVFKGQTIGPTGWYEVDAYGNIYGHGDYLNDDCAIQGNAFKSNAYAEKEMAKREALQRIRKYIYDNDMGFEPNWEDLDQWKYSVHYSHRTHTFWLASDTWCNSGKAFYLKTTKDVNQVIKDCESDLKILLGVED